MQNIDRAKDEQRQMMICFSHLRWGFVFQRPQHIMLRMKEAFDVVYWEEPVRDAATIDRIEVTFDDGIRVVVPHLVPGRTPEQENARLTALLEDFTAGQAKIIRWYYTPMMLPFSRDLAAVCTVYDCMDELAAFRFAPPELLGLEAELLAVADIVFTGGFSLYEAKRDRHPRVLPFPSSVDVAHFARARDITPVARRAEPRLGFYGVIDERMDLDLLSALATARPDWEIEVVGPVVKITPEELPRHPNLSYPGARTYDELPGTLAAWDVALMPFALNESTRFISPTKTPEYLAGGRPVVSTAITDVVRHYGDLEGVIIAADTEAFISGCDAALAIARGNSDWLSQVDAMLARGSWDDTARAMRKEIAAVVAARRTALKPARARYDVVVVGAGFAGAVMAERLATDGGLKVLVVDRRPHIAGNAYDRYDAAGVLMHQYGPHIFHTNSDEIVDYLSRFTKWRPYEHRVLADVGDKRVPMPINRTTLNALYGLRLGNDAEAAAFLASRAEPVADIRTSEDVVVNAIGRELYEKFFRGYTRKQWALDPSELDKSVTSRVPTRTDTDDRYFTDRFQAMPEAGYTAMFAAMLDHPKIELMLGVDYKDIRDRLSFDELVFTGPIDEYFDFRFGKLPYRSLRFDHHSLATEQFQEVATVNYPSEAVPYTRITEYKHLTGQRADVTSITYEYPTAEGDPYYPIPCDENMQLFKRYEALGDLEAGVTFVGRLATYRYYNMDQVVGQALASYRRFKQRRAAQRPEEAVASAA